MSLTVTGIRTDVVTRLKGSTVAGQSVYDSRDIPVDGPDEFPLINVFVPTTREEVASLAAPAYKATSTLRIDGYVKADTEDALAAAIDTIEGQTRTALLNSAAWVRQFESIQGINAQRGLNSEGQRLFGQFALTIDLRYRTSYPPVAEDPFTELGVTVDVIGPTDDGPGPDGSPEATMELAVEGVEVPA